MFKCLLFSEVTAQSVCTLVHSAPNCLPVVTHPLYVELYVVPNVHAHCELAAEHSTLVEKAQSATSEHIVPISASVKKDRTAAFIEK